MVRAPQGTPAPDQQLHDAAEALESMMIKQVLKSSGAFKGTAGVAGADIRTDMFVEAIADAVAQAGGFGLASTLEQQLAPPKPRGQTVDTLSAAELTPPPTKRVAPQVVLKAYHRGDD